MKEKVVAVLVLILTAIAMIAFQPTDSDSKLYQDWKQTHGYSWDPV